jgi:hypothetical protein
MWSESLWSIIHQYKYFDVDCIAFKPLTWLVCRMYTHQLPVVVASITFRFGWGRLTLQECLICVDGILITF